MALRRKYKQRRVTPPKYGSYHRWFYFVRFPGPAWECYFCKGELTDKKIIHIHHLDHKKWDNELGNLVPSHRECHLEHHRGKPT